MPTLISSPWTKPSAPPTRWHGPDHRRHGRIRCRHGRKRRITAGERRIIGVERRITAGEPRIIGVERRITAGEPRILVGERKILAGKRRLPGRQRRRRELARSVSAPRQRTGVPSAASVRVLTTSPETHRRLSPEFPRRILQAPWPNQALQPTPWIAVAFLSLRGRRG